MEFGEILTGVDYQNRLAAYAVILNDQGEVAAVSGRNGFFLPGGGVLAGETFEAALRREVREELAYTIKIIRRLGEAVQYFSAENQHYRMTASFYQAVLSAREKIAAEYELEWLERERISGRFFHLCHEWAIAQIQD